MAKSGFDDTSETVVDGQEAIDQGDQTVGAGGAHQGWPDVRGPLGLIAAASEIKVQLVAGFLCFDVNPNRPTKVDAIVVDEALALGFAVGPRGNRPAHSVFSVGRQEFGGVEHSCFAVAVHQLGHSAFTQSRGTDLAAQIADH